MIRRYGEAVQPGKPYRKRPGAYAVIAQDNAVLLTHQAFPRSEFQLPGGGIDPGESPYQALRREVIEETGWSITGLRKLGVYRRFVFMPEYDMWAEKIAHVFLARPVRAQSKPSEHGHTAVWTSAKTAIDLLANDGDRAFVRRQFI
ncbi:MAG: NUDIX hydrolase [Marinosulfonomonas sp.]|nr:NUDIX hydrolase [Marinosulfonomonas sp.]